MSTSVVFVGFGEAAQAFAEHSQISLKAYDRKTLDPAARAVKLTEAARLGVLLEETNADALRNASVILSLVTADQALSAAQESALNMSPGALFLDMNSVAPGTKQAAMALIEAAQGRYVDVAVMAPVHPKRRAVPLLLSGGYASAAAEALADAGFENIRVVSAEVGAAASIKMIRSIMVKGIEALTAECMLAAEAAGVRSEVVESLDASVTQGDWAARANYNLDRMIVHGVRRAEEMDEVVKTLEGFGIGATMTIGTAAIQRAIGATGLSPPPFDLSGKLAGIAQSLSARREQAA